jgi:hypothetical protein
MQNWIKTKINIYEPQEGDYDYPVEYDPNTSENYEAREGVWTAENVHILIPEEATAVNYDLRS